MTLRKFNNPPPVPIKLLFVGFWLTHYFRDFFNQLQRIPGISVMHVHPAGENKHVGEAVHQTDQEIEFESVQLEEIVVPAKRLLGLFDFELVPAYNDFVGLEGFVRERRPDIAIVDTSYHHAIAYNRKLRRSLDALGCKIVFRSIPFNLPTFEEAVSRVPLVDRIPLRSNRFLKCLFRCSGMDRLYAKLIRNPALLRVVTRDRYVYATADAHVVYHEGGVGIYASWGVPPSRIHVVRNSPDTDKLLAARQRMLNEPISAPPHPHRIIHVGRLVQWKRVDLLVRAVATLRAGRSPDAELLVVGDGPCTEELQALALELGVQQAVNFRGGIYDADELARCFLSASVYVLAGMGGLSINEAMCFGLPVICSRCDGTEKFLVRDGYNGFFFKEGDLDDLVEKVDDILSNEVRWQLMGKRSLGIITEEMNIHTLVNNYLHVFANVRCGEPFVHSA
jgi:glycosyltransferase involved in cell wall biosynthesis